MRTQWLAVMRTPKGKVRHLASVFGDPPYYSLCGWPVIPLPTAVHDRVKPRFRPDCFTCAWLLRIDVVAPIIEIEPEHFEITCHYPSCHASAQLWAQNLDMFRQAIVRSGWHAPQSHRPNLCPDHKERPLMSRADDVKKLQEMQDKATEADYDLEDQIRVLDSLAALRRKDPELEARYELLRDKVVAALKVSGPRYYLDSNGVKRYAFAVQPENVIIDVDELVKMNTEGELSDATLDKVAPRKADNDAFRRAAAKGEVTQDQVARTSTIKDGTPHARFADPIDAK